MSNNLKFNQKDSHGDVLMPGAFDLNKGDVWHLLDHKQLTPPQPQPKSNVKNVLAGKVKAVQTGETIKK